MSNEHKNHDAAFMARFAPEAAKQEKTISQLSSEYGFTKIGQGIGLST